MQAEQFTRIAHDYMDTVYRVAISYLKSPDAADDVTQEVFLRLLRADPTFESEAHIRHWLIRVAVNESKRVLATCRRRLEPLEVYAEKLSFSTEENGETFRAVMCLPRKYRVVIHLHYYEGYSTAEIAQMLGSKQSTVCTQLARGRKLLRNLLLEADDV